MNRMNRRRLPQVSGMAAASFTLRAKAYAWAGCGAGGGDERQGGSAGLWRTGSTCFAACRMAATPRRRGFNVRLRWRRGRV